MKKLIIIICLMIIPLLNIKYKTIESQISVENNTVKINYIIPKNFIKNKISINTSPLKKIKKTSLDGLVLEISITNKSKTKYSYVNNSFKLLVPNKQACYKKVAWTFHGQDYNLEAIKNIPNIKNNLGNNYFKQNFKNIIKTKYLEKIYIQSPDKCDSKTKLSFELQKDYNISNLFTKSNIFQKPTIILKSVKRLQLK